jgi:hypothetical protein
MMDTFELHVIKTKWEKEVDYCLIIAVTDNLKDYPPEVQEIISTEFQKRGLNKHNGKWLTGGLIGSSLEGIPAIKESIDW